MIRRNEAAVAIENAEAIRVAVRGESRASFCLLERFDERFEIFLGWIGACAVEKVRGGRPFRISAVPFVPRPSAGA